MFYRDVFVGLRWESVREAMRVYCDDAFDLRRLFWTSRTQIYLTRWKRVLSDMVLEMYCDRFERYTDLVFSRFGGDLLSHVLRRSTISATALNGRVRNGAGCFARAMATKPRKYQIQVKHVCVYAF